LIVKLIRFFERGTSSSFLSATVTVTNERSCPSALTSDRSAFKDNLDAGPVVFMTSSAHRFPILYATAFSSPGSYFTSSQRRRYAYWSRFFLPNDRPFRKSSTSSPDV